LLKGVEIMQRFRWAAFLAVTTLTMLGLVYFQYRADLQQEKYDRLTRQIDDLQEIYESTARELTEVHEENRDLIQDLHEAIIRIETVEQRNNELETILFNQRQTYRNAVAMQGSSMPVLTLSSFTAKQYERAWSRLGAHGLKGTGNSLVQAEELYNVNSLVLSAIAYLESAGGMSKLAREKNNLFGLGAGGSNPYHNALYFSSKDDCINFTAKLLRNRYLSRSSRSYRGDNLIAIGPRYAEDPCWAEKVGRTMSKIARVAIPGGR
jgi:beta-N-acetylglucosaminidase